MYLIRSFSMLAIQLHCPVRAKDCQVWHEIVDKSAERKPAYVVDHFCDLVDALTLVRSQLYLVLDSFVSDCYHVAPLITQQLVSLTK